VGSLKLADLGLATPGGPSARGAWRLGQKERGSLGRADEPFLLERSWICSGDTAALACVMVSRRHEDSNGRL
jgi:hypothetical protein